MNAFARHWTLDPSLTFLNHGAFGACPRPVLEAQNDVRARMERDPVNFFVRELEPALDDVREVVSDFLNAPPDELAFVPNATAGVNAVLGSLALAPGDEIVCTNHGYNAVANTLDRLSARTGAKVVRADVPFPIAGPHEVQDAVLAAVTPRTKLCVLDHITSPTGLVFPVAEIVAALNARGIDTLVDGAHAPGQVKVDLRALGSAYYTGNFHKWCCAPKGAAVLHVRKDRQAAIHPAIVSHGANSTRTDRPRFLLEFDFTGTLDMSAVLSVPSALGFMGGLLPGGWDELRARNRSLVLTGRHIVARALGCALPCPDEMVGSLAALPLPDARTVKPAGPGYVDALQDALVDRYRIQAPIHPWPRLPGRLVRVSAQLYNQPEHYERLADALRDLLG